MRKKIRRSAVAWTPNLSASVPPHSVPGHMIMYSSLDEDQSTTSLLEDIIVGEILRRLPIKLLFKFKCISKRYKSIISDPKFAQYYLQRAYSSYETWSSSGLFSSILFPFTDLPPNHNIMDLEDNIINSSRFSDQQSFFLSSISLPDDFWRHNILGSSNGLILSVFHPGTCNLLNFGLCVSNPLTKECVQLPDSTFNRFFELEFAISTRCDQAASTFLTYKIVIIRSVSKRVLPHDYTSNTVEIFSSDTGRWSTRELCCPRQVVDHTTSRAVFSYNGILHWLDRQTGTIITYNPFDSPDRFGLINLPKDTYYSDSCLIYSGDQEKLKYCGIHRDRPCRDVDELVVWRLVDSNKGEWCLEDKFEVYCLPRCCMMLMVAPYPWNRNLICHPFMMNNSFMVLNFQTGRWLHEVVYLEAEQASTFRLFGFRYPLVPIELCPWSSPFYGIAL